MSLVGFLACSHWLVSSSSIFFHLIGTCRRRRSYNGVYYEYAAPILCFAPVPPRRPCDDNTNIYNDCLLFGVRGDDLACKRPWQCLRIVARGP